MAGADADELEPVAVGHRAEDEHLGLDRLRERVRGRGRLPRRQHEAAVDHDGVVGLAEALHERLCVLHAHTQRRALPVVELQRGRGLLVRLGLLGLGHRLQRLEQGGLAAGGVLHRSARVLHEVDAVGSGDRELVAPKDRMLLEAQVGDRHAVGHHLRRGDALEMMTIGEGAHEIQRLVIARNVLKMEF